MRQRTDSKLTKIIGEIDCPKDFRCYKSGFKNLCKVKYISEHHYLLCLEEKPHECVFSVSFSQSYICQCPLRIYISQEMKK